MFDLIQLFQLPTPRLVLLGLRFSVITVFIIQNGVILYFLNHFEVINKWRAQVTVLWTVIYQKIGALDSVNIANSIHVVLVCGIHTEWRYYARVILQYNSDFLFADMALSVALPLAELETESFNSFSSFGHIIDIAGLSQSPTSPSPSVSSESSGIGSLGSLKSESVNSDSLPSSPQTTEKVS